MTQELLYYRLWPEDLAGHYFVVEIDLPPSPTGHLLRLPSWIPGSYCIRDFAQHISDLSAYDVAGRTHVVTRLNKNHYSLSTTEAVTIRYRIYAWTWSVRNAILDQYIGFFNPIFCLESTQHSLPILFDCIRTPHTHTWQVATALEKRQASDAHADYFHCDSYTELIDSPLLMGDLTHCHFEVNHIPHHFFVNAHPSYPIDTRRMQDDLRAICTEHHKRMPGVSLNHYTFLGIVHEHARGGLEHAHSTVLMFQQDQLPMLTQKTRSDRYLDLLGLCSHEYFHLWWIKRFRPQEFSVLDLNVEQYTPLLGIFEGFTCYYESQALLSADLITPEYYCEQLSFIINFLNQCPGDMHESLADASLMAWIHHYHPNENTRNTRTNYYLKGHLLAFLLDLIIISGTQGQYTLADALCHLWSVYQKTGHLMQESDLSQSIQTCTGLSLSEIIHQGLHAQQHLDIQPYLSTFALSLSAQYPETLSWEHLGITLKEHCYTIKHITNGSWAHQIGLSAEDHILALNGLKVSEQTLAYCLSNQHLALEIHFFRNGCLRQCQQQIDSHALRQLPERWLLRRTGSNVLQERLFGKHKNTAITSFTS